MRRCQHTCGCDGTAVGRDPDTGLRLCAGCLGRSILGTDCALARRYFVHVPAHFGTGPWTEPPPLRNADHTPPPTDITRFLTIRTGYTPPPWDFMPLAEATAPSAHVAVGAGAAIAAAAPAAGTAPGRAGLGRVRAGTTTVTNPHRPPKDPPPGPLPPPPGRPVQPNPPRR
jgi:hypothetical protein